MVPGFLGGIRFREFGFRISGIQKRIHPQAETGGRRYKLVFAAKGAYLQAFWRKACLIGTTLGRCATISHGKVFRGMKFSKRMLVMLVATVMLVAGSLSYFAYANDVEPCGPVDPLSCPQCVDGQMTETHLRTERGLDSHYYLGDICIFAYIRDVYARHCNRCDYYPTNVTQTYTYGHTRCGQTN